MLHLVVKTSSVSTPSNLEQGSTRQSFLVDESVELLRERKIIYLGSLITVIFVQHYRFTRHELSEDLG